MTERLGPLSDPSVRRERASRGGRSRTGVEYHIRKLVEEAPPLTAEQRDKLALLLRGSSDAYPQDAA
jgi:hypothetical protein